ncbi:MULTISPECIES: DUF294 nucleotidyltransferase-like domain-containing protein [Bacillus]|uniref:DUF294 nucleotidyltransferase-like domain-containing protein n=1 Tax=Bacillus TaxID=1386 RepID=UPI00031FB07D|nr:MULTISPECIES: DUF294 nucleotidyltransferase-like domain-containing protein [Bacillus]
MLEQNQTILMAASIHPFFQELDRIELLNLIGKCEERIFQPNEVILKAQQPRIGLYLLVKGIAEVYIKDENGRRDEVLEVLQKDELFGFSSLTNFLDEDQQIKDSNVETMVEVRAIEQSLVLLIPFDIVSERLRSRDVQQFLLSQVSMRLKEVYRSLAEQVALAREHGERDTLILRVQDLMTLQITSCNPEATIQETAVLMNKQKRSSIIVMENQQLVGIITERDLVERVIAENRPFTTIASEVMTRNPYTISRFSYYYEALSILLMKGIKHLPVTDGYHICGVISLSDLLRKKNEGIMKTIRRIEEADVHSLFQVKNAIYQIFETLLREKVPMVNSLSIITKLYDRLIKRAIQLAIQDIEKERQLKPPVDFNLYVMGSSGRGEQFMLTDQDHFLVFENHTDIELVHNYFRLLGEKIVQYLELAGYAKCKGLMMSSEDTWRGALSEWQTRIREWGVRSTNDQLLLAMNFFSYRMVYGKESLHQQFELETRETLQRCNMFLYRLAQLEQERPIISLGQPIRSLFKLATKSMDVKKDILFPYHHSLQILSMIHHVISGTPFERLDVLEKKGVLEKEFVRDVKEAVNHVLTLYVRLRWENEKRDARSSSVLAFSTLTTREKEELIISVKVLKELQNKIFYHFQMKI